MSFDNCTQAYDAGYANINKGDPNYAAKLDRDMDGVACENPPAGFKPAGEPQAGTKTPTEVGQGDLLPKTGTGMELGIGGSALLMLGIAAALLFRRRRTRFVA